METAKNFSCCGSYCAMSFESLHSFYVIIDKRPEEDFHHLRKLSITYAQI